MWIICNSSYQDFWKDNSLWSFLLSFQLDKSNIFLNTFQPFYSSIQNVKPLFLTFWSPNSGRMDIVISSSDEAFSLRERFWSCLISHQGFIGFKSVTAVKFTFAQCKLKSQVILIWDQLACKKYKWTGHSMYKWVQEEKLPEIVKNILFLIF